MWLTMSLQFSSMYTYCSIFLNMWIWAHRIKAQFWFNSFNMSPWTNKISYGGMKIRRKEERKERRERKDREAELWLLRLWFSSIRWYFLRAYYMHSRSTLSISLWLQENTPLVGLLLQLPCENNNLSHYLVPGDAVKIDKWMFVKYVKSSDERVM